MFSIFVAVGVRVLKSKKIIWMHVIKSVTVVSYKVLCNKSVFVLCNVVCLTIRFSRYASIGAPWRRVGVEKLLWVSDLRWRDIFEFIWLVPHQPDLPPSVTKYWQVSVEVLYWVNLIWIYLLSDWNVLWGQFDYSFIY